MSTNLERMLQQAAVDPEFRERVRQVRCRAVPPEPVQKQDQQFLAVLNDRTQAGEVIQKSRSTCNVGPFTIVCDGGIFGG